MAVAMEEGRPASEAEIQAAERQVGGRFPEAFRRFVAREDGAEPALNEFRFGPTAADTSSVRQFIPLAEIEDTRRQTEFFPRGAFPVADTDTGDHLIMRPGDPSVYFLDHEVLDGIYKLADDFDDFLALLEPVDP